MENFDAATTGDVQATGAAESDPLESLIAHFGAENESDAVEAEDEAAGDDNVTQADDSEGVDDELDNDEEFDDADEDGDEEEEVVKKPKERTHKLKVNGEEVEVKDSDLFEAYSKFQASKGRFDEAANLRKQADTDLQAAQAELTAYKQERDQVQRVMAHYEQQMTAVMKSQEPNWEHLWNTDRTEFLIQKDLWNDKQNQIRQAREANVYLEQQKAKEQQVVNEQVLQKEMAKFIDKHPDWKDQTIARKNVIALDSYLASHGFSEQERTIGDARLMEIAFDAMRYRELMKNDPTKQKQKATVGKTLKPGVSTQSTSKGAAKARADRAFAKNPTAENLAKLL